MGDDINFKDYRVLFVDDKVEFLEGIVAKYEDDFNLVTALGAEEAFNVFEKENIALVISDQKMPNINGLDFLTQVKEKYPGTVRMLLTGFSDIDVVVSAVNKEIIYRYISKNTETDEMAVLIKQGLKKYYIEYENKKLKKQVVSKDKFSAFGQIGIELKNKIAPMFGEIKKHITRDNDDIAANTVEYNFGNILEYLDRLSKVSIKKDEFESKNINEFLDKDNFIPAPAGIRYHFASGNEDEMEILERRMKTPHEPDSVVVQLELAEDLQKIKTSEDAFKYYILKPIMENCLRSVIDKDKIVNADKMTADKDYYEPIIIIRTKNVVKDDERGVCLEIEDNGGGIGNTDVEDLIKPFYSTESGVGLGLTIVNFAVSEHTGSIECEGKGDEGVILRIYLY